MVQWILEEGLQDDVQLVLSVYDSLVFLVRDPYLMMVAKKARQVMTRRVIGYVTMPDGSKRPYPLDADAKYGRTWGMMRKLKIH
jgi:hypothetical protein